MNLINNITKILKSFTKAPKMYREFFAHMIIAVISKNNKLVFVIKNADGSDTKFSHDDAWIKELADMFTVKDYIDKSYSCKRFIRDIESNKKTLATIIPAEIIDEVISSIKKGELPHVK